ncbi:MAG: hypothetical protein ACXAEU_00065 [Candidatus Hodarchaeales archaeon]|jgi:hypothetical protein
MEYEEILQKLTSEDQSERRTASSALKDLANSGSSKIEENAPELLKMILKTQDDLVAMNVASTLLDYTEKVPSANLGQKYYDQVCKILEELSERKMETDADMIGICAIHLMNILKPAIENDMPLLKKSLPLIFNYMEKKHTVNVVAYGIIAPITSRMPKFFEDYTDRFFELVDKGNTALISPLMNMYKFKPESYEKNLEVLLKIFKTDVNYQSLVLVILAEIAKKRAELIEPHVPDFKQALYSPQTASTVATVFAEIARTHPDTIYGILPELKEALDYVDMLKYSVPNILGLIGRQSEERATEVLPTLGKLLAEADQNTAAVLLMEFRNLGDLNRELLVPYMDQIKALTDDPQEYVRDQAVMIVDYMEGRDIRSLANQIEEQNKMIQEAAVSVDSLKKYVDDNVDMLKDFLADVVKKLPIPVDFSAEGRIRKTMKLHFACGCADERCLYPKDRTFTTETKDWNKWTKVAFSAIKIGKAAISIPGNPTSAMDAVAATRELYSAYKSEEDEEFLTFISQPFLTSTEQDSLIEQLKEARFFDMFNYNAQEASWCCIMCKSPG